MNNILNTRVMEWLLEPDNPSVRYFTLKDILEKSDTDSEVRKAKTEIMERGPVPAILAKQKRGGYWGKSEDFYVCAKYRGTVWSFILLAQLGADGSDKRIKKTCKFIIEHSQDRQSGGYSYQGTKKNGGQHSSVIPCLTGNMVWSLIKFGYINHPAVRKGINWMAEYQRYDDGIKEAPPGWPYDKREACWGKHTCYMGVVKTLKALAEIPQGKRTNEIKSTIKNCAEFFLKHHIYKRSHDLKRAAKPIWLKFGFPLMWNTNALEILELLTNLGYKDKRMKEAMDLVISRQDNQGRWILENTYNGRSLVSIEKIGKPSKWVTLDALRTLKKLYGK
jgi:hypothetical protein